MVDLILFFCRTKRALESIFDRQRLIHHFTNQRLSFVNEIDLIDRHPRVIVFEPIGAQELMRTRAAPVARRHYAQIVLTRRAFVVVIRLARFFQQITRRFVQLFFFFRFF